jgi:hypothetical protein
MVGDLFQFSGFRAYCFLIAPGDMLVGFGPSYQGIRFAHAVLRTKVSLWDALHTRFSRPWCVASVFLEHLLVSRMLFIDFKRNT